MALLLLVLRRALCKLERLRIARHVVPGPARIHHADWHLSGRKPGDDHCQRLHEPHLRSDLLLVAVPAVTALGLAKGGFSGVGMLATPLLALVMPPLQAAAFLLPILIMPGHYFGLVVPARLGRLESEGAAARRRHRHGHRLAAGGLCLGRACALAGRADRRRRSSPMPGLRPRRKSPARRPRRAACSGARFPASPRP